jgi:ribonucleoside-diphosphate reductase alpha chain
MPQRGLEHTRRFCPNGTRPYETVEWTKYDAVIENPKTGKTVFEQKAVVFPESWSQQSVNIVASKYFFGDLDAKNGSPAEGNREYHLKQLIDRVGDTIADEGHKRGYFRTHEDKIDFLMDLKWLLLHQHAAFNSPVWFNVGLGQAYGVKEGDEQNLLFNKNSAEEPVEEVDPYVFPQAAACFILEINDDIDAIWDTMKESARLFKFGSGVGADWSKLRSSKESVSGGGTASGPVSFMRVQDATGATIKSGGKTRRSAIMDILRADHPDIWEFVNVKKEEEDKAKSLIKDGYDPSFNGEAYGTADFQDVNMSVRIDDDFFEMIEDDEAGVYKTEAVTSGKVLGTYAPYKLLRRIAKNTHECGDPGIQYDGAIQRWHTCPESGRINGSNPCSEFLFLDNTACNLASINLRKMETEDGWDPKRLRKTAEIMFTAQDILCDIAGYPSKDIAEMSENFRPLGLGFANLGATLMQKGIAYDSNKGRAIAAGLQSIIHFAAYNRSTKMAKALEPFSKYEKNEDDFLKVMTQHRNALADLVHGDHDYLSDITKEGDLPCEDASELMLYAKELAGEMYKRGSIYGYRNSQATVIAPTGTISFYMGCTTTGIEPSPALVQYKALAGSEDSMIKIVNDCVGEAILALGYDPDAATLVEEYVKSNDTIEGVNDVLWENGYKALTNEEMEVFDTAMSQGDHSIDPTGHIDMMASVQPFVSGAISKTVNLPENATVEDVEDAYMRGWRLGLKALAIYRDGSKDSQPVNTTDGSENADKSENNGSENDESKNSEEAEEEPNAFEQALGEEIEYAAAIEVIDSALDDGKVSTTDVLDQLKIGMGPFEYETAIRTIQEAIEDGAGDLSILGDLGITPSELPIGSSDRRKLPDQAPSIRKKFQVGAAEGYIHVGLYPDTKKPGEVFITVSKEGSTLAGVMDSFATSISLALQYGVPLEDLVEKFKNQRFEPSGFTGDDIKSATSIVDYVAKFLEQEFLKEDAVEAEPVDFSKPQVTQSSETSDEADEEHVGETLDEFAERVCENCGSIMRQDGTCFVCPTCGEDTGCGG